ncbi:hypothetical protein GCM10011490_09160 [Pseudoclavibacter endophyticus]|uniref:Aminotransferase class V-fold PLP-dependent enzyme n=1 Tax=Pseudoclavibacter endophyticus TaxID=1778590 RepID=A0A6H9WT97_9MICO|nr:aminotransferase class V-fold PLP-dependent enzyme [Pseudoclavibacter endophyticus]KAB1649624.1 aminotransferase class V-fold PLP-dependent enzyme [Pseudoclavibacter endophyticus]GGA61144.1 hypothetical protein GCM10011490_09160 [Pseudoclavibacter endophyticus]
MTGLTLDHDAWARGVRRDFMHRDDRVYLQSAGTGLPVPRAAEAAGDYYREVALHGCEAGPHWQARARDVRARLAPLLGVAPNEVDFFRNTSEIVNLAANSIDWSPDDEIVVFADEYPCNVLPWMHAEGAGARLVRLNPTEAHRREDQLLEAITPRTRVVSVSHVHPWTGTRLDLERVGRACRDADALFIVDGIQSLGAVPVDLRFVDVFGAGVFKWMLSGFGTAIGVFRERARDRLVPVFRSYGNPAPSTAFSYAAPNYPGLYVLDATLEHLEGLGWERIHGRIEQLTAHAFAALDAIGVTPVTPIDRRAGIVAIDVADSAAAAAELGRRGVSVSDKEGRVLISPHFYNDEADIERFVEAFGSLTPSDGR